MAFVTCQNASALTINAIPQKQEFSANDWIKVDITIQGYNGGQINWVAHRPDNSVISGIIEQQIKSEKITHQIIRDANDNEFGPWSINYLYGGVNQTVHFNVKPLALTVITDKITYYEPDIMNINITSSYYTPYAKFAPSYFLDFYDQDEKKAIGIEEIEVKADRPSVLYQFPMLKFSKYNPPGLYKLKIQYFNSVMYVPFLLGDIHKLMELSVQSKTSTYHLGDDVILDLFVTNVKESTGIVTITDPTGNTTSLQFPVDAIHSQVSLRDVSKKIGIYKFNVQYAGVKNAGTFQVVADNNKLPKIDLDMYLNKWNYRKNEIVEARVYTSDIIANSIDSWTIDPQGISHEIVSIPVSLNDVIIPHKISKNDQVGKWQFYVNYGGVVRSSIFYVGGETMEDSELLNSGQFHVPKYPSSINSEFRSPTGITIDSDNNVYIADSGNSQIKKFDSKGNLLFTLGTLGSSKGEFRHPLGVFVNEKYVYVLDTGNSRIQIFDKNGNFIYSWGKYGDQPGMFHTPVSMSSDKYGNLFVADSELNVIQIFDRLGNYKDEISPVLAEGKEIGNTGIKVITFDSKNNFYIISTNNEILKYSSIGNFINFYGSNGTEDGRFNQPSAIVVDAENYLYVADSGAHRIQKFDSNGNFILSWGSAIDEVDEFDAPVGLAIDSLNDIYVVDKNQGTVQKFATNNIAGTVLPNWVKKNSMWWSEGALDKSDFTLAVKYIIKQGLIQISPTSKYYSIPENSSASVDQLKKNIQLWSSGKIDSIPLIPENSVKVPEWVKKNVQLWSSGKIDDQIFFRSIEYLLSSGIMKI
ncbi:MAG: NHL repeat-containing protein [Nitrosotalea sp.]